MSISPTSQPPPPKGIIFHIDKYHDRCWSHSGHSPDQEEAVGQLTVKEDFSELKSKW